MTMGCCGQKREGLRGAVQASTSHAPAHGNTTGIDPRGARAAATRSLGSHVVAVRYVERLRLVVRGPATGRQYEFSAAKATQMVAAHDADALLRTRYFVRG
jgi:hypothetical protein